MKDFEERLVALLRFLIAVDRQCFEHGLLLARQVKCAADGPEVIGVKFIVAEFDMGLFHEGFGGFFQAIGGDEFRFQVIAQLEQVVGIQLGIDKLFGDNGRLHQFDF